jgi:hypothetical protein
VIFDIVYTDGSKDVAQPGPADVVAFENERGTTLGQAIASGSPQWTYFLAHHYLKRAGGEGRTFDAWLDDVASIGSATTEAAADPTSAGSAENAAAGS